MRASLSNVCLSSYYIVPTQTFRYYPGYPYIKYLPQNSIIATSLWSDAEEKYVHKQSKHSFKSIPRLHHRVYKFQTFPGVCGEGGGGRRGHAPGPPLQYCFVTLSLAFIQLLGPREGFLTHQWIITGNK